MYLECMSSVWYFPERQDEGEVMQTYNALYFYLGHSFSPGRNKHCQDRGNDRHIDESDASEGILPLASSTISLASWAGIKTDAERMIGMAMGWESCLVKTRKDGFVWPRIMRERTGLHSLHMFMGEEEHVKEPFELKDSVAQEKRDTFFNLTMNRSKLETESSGSSAKF